jgi:hypothetical protein
MHHRQPDDALQALEPVQNQLYTLHRLMRTTPVLFEHVHPHRHIFYLKIP